MKEQFFNKTTWRVFFGLALATILGAALYRVPTAHPIALALIGLAGAALFWRKPEVAFVVVFAELFAFSHGKLFEVDVLGFTFTSRMALFVGIMLAWALKAALRRVRVGGSVGFWSPWVLLGVGLLVGLVVGLLNNNPRSALDDFNGYVYGLYLLPLLSIPWTREARGELIRALMGSALWMSVLSLALLYIFTHLPNEALETTYRFIRDARIGEITLMEGGYWRVFLQSQIVLIPALLLLLAFDLDRPRQPWLSRWLVLTLAFVSSGLVVSLSRSFWIGLVAGLPFLALLFWRTGERKRLFVRAPGWVWGLILGFALLATAALTVFPVPSRVVDLREAFSRRSTDLGDVAISSRWNLLPVMVEEMQSSPILGSGFGKELAFVTDDPRARAIYPDGKWRTYKFEWGWLDLWVKMGVIGFLAYVMIFLTYDRLIRESLDEPLWLRLGLRASLLALAAIHVFSPYLNHPLGIGLLLFATAFLDMHGPRPSEVLSRLEEKLALPVMAPPPVTTQTEPLRH